MRVIHNNLQQARDQPPSVMDKLRNNFNQLCPLLRARYRKLFDDYASSKENIPLLIQSADYVSYSCSCCGRTQKLQAEELNTIVGNAFRMAYAARLQRSCLAGPGSAGDDSAWEMESRNNHDKTNNRTWGRRSKHREPSRRELSRGKNVNLASPAAAAPAAPGAQEPTRLAAELRCPLLAGYVNEAVSTTDSESRSSEGDVRPLSAAGRSVSASSQSLREDTKSCHWSSASSSASASHHAEGTSGASTPLPPPYYQQGPSQERVELRSAAWFQAGIPREIALEVLSQEPVGAFMVRESTTKHGCYALSLRVPRDFQVSGIAHYLILKTAKGYKIKGFMKEFTSLTALITHHSVIRYNPNFVRSESAQDLVELDTDSEYNGLSELSRANR
ncbi:tensin-4-like [Pollicipes pollicipes]|uniref:tensin-4-like n=1 Tax=Pollicipes pollicipes TaxID=41117 RepID=UPI001884A2B8|nr:tensin-4-like [Pollicipes pollicipes]